LSHGQYLNDDYVDMHGVLASRWRPGTVIGIARAGMFRSDDAGDHWSHVPLEPLNPRATSIAVISARCRQPASSVGGGRRRLPERAGTLLHSRDGGDSWDRVDIGHQVPHTMFKLAFDERQPSRMSCATNGGEVWTSTDSGERLAAQPPPAAAAPVYAWRAAEHPKHGGNERANRPAKESRDAETPTLAARRIRAGPDLAAIGGA